jgi:hypothetical protein
MLAEVMGTVFPPLVGLHGDAGRSSGLPFEASPPGPLSSGAGEGEHQREKKA